MLAALPPLATQQAGALVIGPCAHRRLPGWPHLHLPSLQEARLRDIMGSLHESFKGAVQAARGERLAAGREDELWSGAPWAGARCVLPARVLAQLHCLAPASCIALPMPATSQVCCRACTAGRAWTGTQALDLGLVDGLGDMRSVLQQQFGEKARFLLCR